MPSATVARIASPRSVAAKLVNDIVQCPYHGLHFDDSGLCVYNPHGDGKIPAKARVPQYPVCEQHDLIWLWIGEPELADEAKIPDFSCLADTQGFRTVGGIIEMHANYTLVIDNLMDLTHVEYVHEGTVGNEGIADGEHIVEQNGTTVYSEALVYRHTNCTGLESPRSATTTVSWIPGCTCVGTRQRRCCSTSA